MIIFQIWSLFQVWPGQTVYPDFFHPKAFDYWYQLVSDFIKILAFDGLWIVSIEVLLAFYNNCFVNFRAVSLIATPCSHCLSILAWPTDALPPESVSLFFFVCSFLLSSLCQIRRNLADTLLRLYCLKFSFLFSFKLCLHSKLLNLASKSISLRSLS